MLFGARSERFRLDDERLVLSSTLFLFQSYSSEWAHTLWERRLLYVPTYLHLRLRPSFVHGEHVPTVNVTQETQDVYLYLFGHVNPFWRLVLDGHSDKSDAVKCEVCAFLEQTG